MQYFHSTNEEIFHWSYKWLHIPGTIQLFASYSNSSSKFFVQLLSEETENVTTQHFNLRWMDYSWPRKSEDEATSRDKQSDSIKHTKISEYPKIYCRRTMDLHHYYAENYLSERNNIDKERIMLK